MTTLGELFPELASCRPVKSQMKKKPGTGTAQTLKKLYPEIEGWDPFYVTSAWLYWGKTCGIRLDDPTTRDERFPEFLVTFIHTKFLEVQASIKPVKRSTSSISAAFQQLEASSHYSFADEQSVGGTRKERDKWI
jgi:hypothetical protein